MKKHTLTLTHAQRQAVAQALRNQYNSLLIQKSGLQTCLRVVDKKIDPKGFSFYKRKIQNNKRSREKISILLNIVKHKND